MLASFYADTYKEDNLVKNSLTQIGIVGAEVVIGKVLGPLVGKAGGKSNSPSASSVNSILETQGLAIKGIQTPWGVAKQATDPLSMAARAQIQEGATLYRIGTTGKSQAAEAQFWSLENPFSADYAQQYGIPASNVKNANFIETATLKPGSPFVTRPAPGVGSNSGGGIEVVIPENGVQMRAFNYEVTK